MQKVAASSNMMIDDCAYHGNVEGTLHSKSWMTTFKTTGNPKQRTTPPISQKIRKHISRFQLRFLDTITKDAVMQFSSTTTNQTTH